MYLFFAFILRQHVSTADQKKEEENTKGNEMQEVASGRIETRPF